MEYKFKGSPTPWGGFSGQTDVSKIYKIDVKDDNGNHLFFSKTINIASSEGKVIAEVKALTTDLFENDFEKFEANFHLICAAPDLLKACQYLYSELTCMMPNIEETETCKDAMKAINKALNKYQKPTKN